LRRDRVKEANAMQVNDNKPADVQLHRALALMEEALKLLDERDGPPHVGAHLDAAILSLRDAIPGGTSPSAIRASLQTRCPARLELP